MTKIIADLHIHSHYSMATSKELTPEKLDWWAARKGINVVGSGDISHPGWLKELEEKLENAEDGLYKLKDRYYLNDGGKRTAGKVRFLLSGEISSIYKDKGKTRKIHQVFLLPNMETAHKFQVNLEKRNVNIRSDGRPICGISARNLLELALETDERIYCIPAHIWTPWFSLFGAKSGYDVIEDCYEDLTGKIMTLETGLSADVPMIRKISALDRFGLISSSDAHSPSKLGRNATIIDAEYDWQSIITALQNGKTETIDSYPELGKYHYDGHRKCGICFHPRETSEHQGICPKCGKPLTIGVLNRAYQLADRKDNTAIKSWHYLLPLPEILSKVMGFGQASKRVQNRYNEIMDSGYSEMELLLEKGSEKLSKTAGEEIAQFLKKYKSRDFEMKPGYDGEFGKVL